MPLQLPNFQRIGFEEANPFLRGMQGGIGLHKNLAELQQAIMANQKAQAELPYAGQMAKGTAAYKEAMAKYLGSPSQALKNVSHTGKMFLEPQILQALENYYGIKIPNREEGFNYSPEQQNQIQNNEESPFQPSQEQIPQQESEGQPGEDINQTYKNIRLKESTDPVMGRNAQKAQIIHNQVKDIDPKPLEKYAGFKGKLKFAMESAKNQMGYKPSQDWRDYKQFISANKYQIMDGIRQMLATSIQPDYVIKTIGPMVDASADAWNDPEQVNYALKELKNWTKEYAGEQTEAYAKGVPTTLEEAERRHEKYSNKTAKNENKEEYSKGAKNLAKSAQWPSFSSKDEYRNWFARQTPTVQEAYILHLKSKGKK